MLMSHLKKVCEKIEKDLNTNNNIQQDIHLIKQKLREL